MCADRVLKNGSYLQKKATLGQKKKIDKVEQLAQEVTVTELAPGAVVSRVERQQVWKPAKLDCGA